VRRRKNKNLQATPSVLPGRYLLKAGIRQIRMLVLTEKRDEWVLG
jgi:hypothetical protein